MSTRRALSIAVITISCLLALSACKNNQTQQQSASTPSSSSSSGGASGSSSSSPSSSSPSSSGGSSGSSGSSGRTASLPSGSSSPGGSSMPSGGGQPGGSSLPSGGGVPGSSMPSGGPAGGGPTAGEPGGGVETASADGNDSGNGGGRPGQPQEDSPYSGGDADGDGVPDTAQSGSAGENVDFSESTGGGGGGGAPAQSREEQVAVLDGKLEGSMRDYDGRILEERAGVMGRAGQEGANEQLEDFDRSVAYYDEAEGDGAAGENESVADEAPPSGRPGGPKGLPSKNGGSRDVITPPDNIPCADNDDVVARQIREAAMNEKDAELRDALWEEYRKYKEQANQGASC